MEEALIQCEGYTSDALMKALAPYVEGSAVLELRPRRARVRSPQVDPNVLAGIIQAGATVATALIAGLIGWRRSAGRTPATGDRTNPSNRPIRIYGAGGVIIEIPLDTDEETLAVLVERVRQIDRPRIHLL
ncbi:MAG: hypothetical protein ACJ8GN_26880 [Longimicrobiaceae bacterium]